jgi:hypothetical protein
MDTSQSNPDNTIQIMWLVFKEDQPDKVVARMREEILRNSESDPRMMLASDDILHDEVQQQGKTLQWHYGIPFRTYKKYPPPILSLQQLDALKKVIYTIAEILSNKLGF